MKSDEMDILLSKKDKIHRYEKMGKRYWKVNKWRSDGLSPILPLPTHSKGRRGHKTHRQQLYLLHFSCHIFFFDPIFSPSNTFTQKNADLWHFYFTALKNYFRRMQVFFAASAQCWPKYKIIPTKRGSAVTITVGFVGLMVSI